MHTRSVARIPAVLALLFAVLTGCGSGDGGGTGDGGAVCFSPSQGRPADLVGTVDSHGCACDESKDKPVCVTLNGPDYGLACIQGHWQRVEDGPCSPLLPDAGSDLSSNDGTPPGDTQTSEGPDTGSALSDECNRQACEAHPGYGCRYSDGDASASEACCKPNDAGALECLP
jgi:hypothetical protein